MNGKAEEFTRSSRPPQAQPAGGHADAQAEGHRHHGEAVVVGMLADQVDTPRHADQALGLPSVELPAEVFPQVSGCIFHGGFSPLWDG